MHLTLTKELDIIGATFSFLSTLFYMAASRWAWPVSLIAISINMVLYTKTGLFADVFKESIYAVSCMIGWYWWRRGGKHQKTLAISNLSLKHGAILSIAALLSTLALSTVLIKWTSSQVPYWDATTTILSLTAQWLICRKIIECWILWGIVDGLYAGLYFHKAIPVHGFLLTLYTLMAVIGYISWDNKKKASFYRSS